MIFLPPLKWPYETFSRWKQNVPDQFIFGQSMMSKSGWDVIVVTIIHCTGNCFCRWTTVWMNYSTFWHWDVKFVYLFSSQHDITGRALVRMHENTLLRLGIVNPQHREDIWREIMKLRLKTDILEIRDLERKNNLNYD